MKKNNLIVTLLFLTIMFFSSCADNKTIKGVEYRPCGLFNENTCKNDSIQYEIAVDATICGVLFCELIAPPIYVFGFNLWEPVGIKKGFDSKKGVVK